MDTSLLSLCLWGSTWIILSESVPLELLMRSSQVNIPKLKLWNNYSIINSDCFFKTVCRQEHKNIGCFFPTQNVIIINSVKWKVVSFSELFSTNTSHGVIAQLLCTQIPMSINSGQLVWAEVMLPCTDLGFENILCSPHAYSLYCGLDKTWTTAEKFQGICWICQSHKIAGIYDTESLFRGEPIRTVIWSGVPALCADTQER